MPTPHHGEGEAQQRVLRGFRIAVGLSLMVLVIESIGAFFSRSLSLTVDAVHNVPDVAAFAISYAALASTRDGSSDRFTFGTHRLEVFAGIVNGAIVLGAGLVFGYEAVDSLVRATTFAGPVDAAWLLLAAVPTLGLRAVNLRVLAPGSVRSSDLNLRSVAVHLASDIAITGALLVAGGLLLVRPDLAWVDPLAALVIAGVLVREAVPLLREGADVLTERTPRGISIDAISKSTLAVPGVAEVHDIHVWSVCSSLVCMTAHVTVRDMSLQESIDVVESLRARMEREFGILHATFQVECPPAA